MQQSVQSDSLDMLILPLVLVASCLGIQCFHVRHSRNLKGCAKIENDVYCEEFQKESLFCCIERSISSRIRVFYIWCWLVFDLLGVCHFLTYRGQRALRAKKVMGTRLYYIVVNTAELVFS